MKSIQQQDDTAIRERAAQWVCELEENASPEKQSAFLEWLQISPRHVNEFLMVSAVNDEFVHYQSTHPINVQVLSGEIASNVVKLSEPPAPHRIQPSTRPFATKVSWGLIAASICLVIAGAIWFGLRNSILATGIGEQRIVSLSDGSMVHLNTQSQIKLQFSETSRDLVLVNGEALFKVARDSTRPFRVHVNGAVVQAMGTAFNIRRGMRDAVVVVTEGSVRVEPQTAARTSDSTLPENPVHRANIVRAGEQVLIKDHGQSNATGPTDLDKALAWRQRRLVFRGETLQEVASEFNRYNKQPQLQVIGDQARQKRMMGVFDADDPAALVLFIERLPDLSVEHAGDRIIIRSD